jgi:hypothetical protein
MIWRKIQNGDAVLSWLGMEGYSMNERLLELAKQAGLKKDHASDREYIGDFDWRQFAELIIRECADIATMNTHQYDTTGSYVLKHFGVEE